MHRLRPYAVEIALAVILVACGVLPWLPFVDLLPWGADATKWIAHSSLDSPRWWQWATDTKHFVGYRPVTALAFVLNHALTGYSPVGYAAFDITLNVLAGLLVFLLYRALFADRSAFGLVPVLLLLGHPAVEEVVPYVARRSYLLATVFGLASLLAWLRAARPGWRGWAWAFAAAGLLGLAVLSNEVAYVLLPLFPLFLLDRASWRTLPALLPSLLVCALAVVKRHEVLGVWGGGYQKRFFAFVRNHVPMWRERTSWDPDSIAAACWRYVLDPVGVDGRDPLFPGIAGDAVSIALGLWLAWYGIVRPLRRWREPGARVPLILATWLVGSTAIVVLSQTWFWRQAYSLLPPLGMLLACTVGTTWRSIDALGARAVPTLTAGGVLLATALWNGPLRGVTREAHAIRFDGTPVALAVRDRLEAIPGPAIVWLVVPVKGSASHIVRLWADRYGGSRKITARVLAHSRPGAAPQAADLELTVPPDGDRARLRLVRGLMWVEAPSFSGVPADARLDLSRLWHAGKASTWVIGVDAEESFAFEVRRPPPGTSLLTTGPQPEPDDAEEPLDEEPLDEEPP